MLHDGLQGSRVIFVRLLHVQLQLLSQDVQLLDQVILEILTNVLLNPLRWLHFGGAGWLNLSTSISLVVSIVVVAAAAAVLVLVVVVVGSLPMATRLLFNLRDAKVGSGLLKQ